MRAVDRAPCCSAIPFGAVALEVRFRPAPLALPRCEAALARARTAPKLRTRQGTAFRGIELNGDRPRTRLARAYWSRNAWGGCVPGSASRARIAPKTAYPAANPRRQGLFSGTLGRIQRAAPKPSGRNPAQ